MSYADRVFVDMCEEIINRGIGSQGMEVRPRWEDGTPAHTIKRFGVVNRYDLSREFPAITLRRTAIKSCVNEMLWIWQKKSNNIRDLKSSVWDEWADEEGSIGKAYGYQIGKKYLHHTDADGSPVYMDQIDAVLYDLRHNPFSRRIMVNMYNFDDLHEMHLYPCAYSMTFNVTGNKLNAILNQRSQDMITANNWNVEQYALLVHLFAQVSDLEVGEFVHVIADAHIYDRHLEMAEALLEKTPLEAPKLVINPDKKDFYAFNVEDIALEGYQYHDFPYKIPVAE